MTALTDLRQINGAWFRVSPHALQRAVDPEQVSAVLGRPRHVKRAKAGRELWTNGKVSAVVAESDGFWTVVTFLWATANGWVSDREVLHSRDGGRSAERMRAFRYATKQRKKGTAQ